MREQAVPPVPVTVVSILTVLAVGLALLVAPAPVAQAEGHVSHEVVDGAEGTPIAITIYRPDGASADNPAPVIFHSHGWSGSRTTTESAFATERARGYGVVSIDQRGHGESGGQRHVQSPDLEGRDIVAVIDRVAELDWVLKDTDAEGNPIPDDPVLFAMGGSYGGGYQLVGALTDQQLRAEQGRAGTRFNAIAPEIAWFNLARALAPEGVVRTAWVTLLYAAGADRVADHIHSAFVYGATTGQWPDGTAPVVADLEQEFHRNGPSGFVADGLRLDIPVLIGQGLTDNLFNGNEGWHTFEQALTPAAQSRSLYVGYNGGHALPNVLPVGAGSGGDPCSALPEGVGGFSQLRLAFFDAVRAGDNPQDLLASRYSLATVDGDCVQSSHLDRYETVPLAGLIQVDSETATTTGAGVPQHIELVQGPVTIAGVPQVRADISSAGVDQRAFFALSVGSNPIDAQVIQNNMMPLRELTPVVRESRTIELPLVAVEVPEGQSLFLTISPVSDMSFGHGSIRSPGAVLLERVEVDLPVPVQEPIEEPDDPADHCPPGRDGNPGRGRGSPPPCPGASVGASTAAEPQKARQWWPTLFGR